MVKPHPAACHSAHPLTYRQVNDPPAAPPVPEREHLKSLLPPENGLQREARAVKQQRQYQKQKKNHSVSPAARNRSLTENPP
ncbi:hypothetical protein HP093_005242 [Salmonella enterica]|nr:hypothetical protein [Salmonella enterica]